MEEIFFAVSFLDRIEVEMCLNVYAPMLEKQLANADAKASSQAQKWAMFVRSVLSQSGCPCCDDDYVACDALKRVCSLVNPNLTTPDDLTWCEEVDNNGNLESKEKFLETESNSGT